MEKRFEQMLENNSVETSIEEELPLEQKVEILEDENKELKNRLETLYKFQHILGHDLRNPITSIISLTELIQIEAGGEEINKEEIINISNMIKESSENTLNLTDDLLKWLRHQEKEGKPNIQILELADQIEVSIRTCIDIAKRKNININNEVPKDVEVLADSNMLKTVVRNLSSNAIKFTNEGGDITISSKKKNNLVEIYVKDNGIGMSEKTISELFVNLITSNQGTGGEKGTGFGLFTCKEILDKMNGTIRVESELGKGSTFIISLPSGEERG